MHNYKTISVLALLTFCSDALEFNHQAFQDKVTKAYVIDSSLQTLNAKNVLDELFDVKDIKIREALNTICENEVGSTMIKLFYQNKEKMRSKIGGKVNIQTVDNDDCYAEYDLINVDIPELSAITTAGLTNKRFSKKKESLDSVLFHELGHIFHYIMDSHKEETSNTIECLYGNVEAGNFAELWSNDEEFYNITGYYYDGTSNQLRFDPLNCNMYDICKQCKLVSLKTEITQRIFHCLYGDISV